MSLGGQLRVSLLCGVLWSALFLWVGCAASQQPQNNSHSELVQSSANSPSDPNARYRSSQHTNPIQTSVPSSQPPRACNGTPGPNEAAAKRLMLRAMDIEYLNASFDQALSLLNQGNALCSKNQCSDTLGAKILMSAAVVQSNGKQNKELATQAIREGLHRCTSAVIERDYMTGELEKVFNEEKKNLLK